jgi:hypothetical protein
VASVMIGDGRDAGVLLAALTSADGHHPAATAIVR